MNCGRWKAFYACSDDFEERMGLMKAFVLGSDAKKYYEIQGIAPGMRYENLFLFHNT